MDEDEEYVDYYASVDDQGTYIQFADHPALAETLQMPDYPTWPFVFIEYLS